MRMPVRTRSAGRNRTRPRSPIPKLTVFDSREIVYRISTVAPCLGQVGDPPFALRWEAPSGTAAVFRSTLSAPEFEQFKIFLDRADVRAIQSFMNAGPGVGDFRVAIARSGWYSEYRGAVSEPEPFPACR